MLKYLMKYDLKKMLKFLVWFYLISLVLAGVTRFFAIWKDIQFMSIISGVVAGFTYSAIASILINTFIHIILRFTTSFYKDQSYLTHTLPVKKDKLILSKYLSSLIVVFLSVLVCFLSLFIMFYTPEFMQKINFLLDQIVIGLNLSSGLFVFLIVTIIFAQICTTMSMVFMAIVKGNQSNHKRGAKSFLWFSIFYIVCSLISILLVVLLTAITGDINTLFASKMSSGAFLSVLLVGLIAYVIYSILFYFLCQREFKKGVNVD